MYLNPGGANAPGRYGLTGRSRKKSYEPRRYNRTLLAARLNRRGEKEMKEREGEGDRDLARALIIASITRRSRKNEHAKRRSLVGERVRGPGYIETPYHSGVGSVRAHASSSRCLPVLYETRKLVKCVIMLNGGAFGHSRRLPPTSVPIASVILTCPFVYWLRLVSLFFFSPPSGFVVFLPAVLFPLLRSHMRYPKQRHCHLRRPHVAS